MAAPRSAVLTTVLAVYSWASVGAETELWRLASPGETCDEHCRGAGMACVEDRWPAAAARLPPSMTEGCSLVLGGGLPEAPVRVELGDGWSLCAWEGPERLWHQGRYSGVGNRCQRVPHKAHQRMCPCVYPTRIGGAVAWGDEAGLGVWWFAGEASGLSGEVSSVTVEGAFAADTYYFTQFRNGTTTGRWLQVGPIVDAMRETSPLKDLRKGEPAWSINETPLMTSPLRQMVSNDGATLLSFEDGSVTPLPTAFTQHLSYAVEYEFGGDTDAKAYAHYVWWDNPRSYPQGEGAAELYNANFPQEFDSFPAPDDDDDDAAAPPVGFVPPPRGGRFRQIAATRSAFAGLFNNGSVVTWGEPATGGIIPNDTAPLLTGVAQLFATRAAFCAILGDGGVVAWGDADHGGSIPDYVQSRIADAQVITIAASEAAFAAWVLYPNGNTVVVSWGHALAGGATPLKYTLAPVSEASQAREAYWQETCKGGDHVVDTQVVRSLSICDTAVNGLGAPVYEVGSYENCAKAAAELRVRSAADGDPPPRVTRSDIPPGCVALLDVGGEVENATLAGGGGFYLNEEQWVNRRTWDGVLHPHTHGTVLSPATPVVWNDYTPPKYPPSETGIRFAARTSNPRCHGTIHRRRNVSTTIVKIPDAPSVTIAQADAFTLNASELRAAGGFPELAAVQEKYNVNRLVLARTFNGRADACYRASCDTDVTNVAAHLTLSDGTMRCGLFTPTPDPDAETVVAEWGVAEDLEVVVMEFFFAFEGNTTVWAEVCADVPPTERGEWRQAPTTGVPVSAALEGGVTGVYASRTGLVATTFSGYTAWPAAAVGVDQGALEMSRAAAALRDAPACTAAAAAPPAGNETGWRVGANTRLAVAYDADDVRREAATTPAAAVLPTMYGFVVALADGRVMTYAARSIDTTPRWAAVGVVGDFGFTSRKGKVSHSVMGGAPDVTFDSTRRALLAAASANWFTALLHDDGGVAGIEAAHMAIQEFYQLRDVGCYWNAHTRDRWLKMDGGSTPERCAQLCLETPGCVAFEFPHSSTYCAPWMFGACSHQYGDKNEMERGGMHDDATVDLFILKSAALHVPAWYTADIPILPVAHPELQCSGVVLDRFSDVSRAACAALCAQDASCNGYAYGYDTALSCVRMKRILPPVITTVVGGGAAECHTKVTQLPSGAVTYAPLLDGCVGAGDAGVHATPEGARDAALAACKEACSARANCTGIAFGAYNTPDLPNTCTLLAEIVVEGASGGNAEDVVTLAAGDTGTDGGGDGGAISAAPLCVASGAVAIGESAEYTGLTLRLNDGSYRYLAAPPAPGAALQNATRTVAHHGGSIYARAEAFVAEGATTPAELMLPMQMTVNTTSRARKRRAKLVPVTWRVSVYVYSERAVADVLTAEGLASSDVTSCDGIATCAGASDLAEFKAFVDTQLAPWRSPGASSPRVVRAAAVDLNTLYSDLASYPIPLDVRTRINWDVIRDIARAASSGAKGYGVWLRFAPVGLRGDTTPIASSQDAARSRLDLYMRTPHVAPTDRTVSELALGVVQVPGTTPVEVCARLCLNVGFAADTDGVASLLGMDGGDRVCTGFTHRDVDGACTTYVGKRRDVEDALRVAVFAAKFAAMPGTHFYQLNRWMSGVVDSSAAHELRAGVLPGAPMEYRPVHVPATYDAEDPVAVAALSASPYLRIPSEAVAANPVFYKSRLAIEHDQRGGGAAMAAEHPPPETLDVPTGEYGRRGIGLAASARRVVVWEVVHPTDPSLVPPPDAGDAATEASLAEAHNTTSRYTMLGYNESFDAFGVGDWDALIRDDVRMLRAGRRSFGGVTVGHHHAECAQAPCAFKETFSYTVTVGDLQADRLALCTDEVSTSSWNLADFTCFCLTEMRTASTAHAVSCPSPVALSMWPLVLLLLPALGVVHFRYLRKRHHQEAQTQQFEGLCTMYSLHATNDEQKALSTMLRANVGREVALLQTLIPQYHSRTDEMRYFLLVQTRVLENMKQGGSDMHLLPLDLLRHIQEYVLGIALLTKRERHPFTPLGHVARHSLHSKPARALRNRNSDCMRQPSDMSPTDASIHDGLSTPFLNS